ncbi:MAG: carboxyl-terminal processing protease [Flavobacteriaceae bacterium]|jgi:carboxyl-terminal processing protease
MQTEQRKNSYKYYIITFLVLAIVFILGIFIGIEKRPAVDKIAGLMNKESVFVEKDADFDSFWQVWRLLDEKYPNIDEVSLEKRIWGATKGLVESMGDPYTVFFDPEESEKFEESLGGEFSGVGMEVGIRDEILTVIAPLKNTPADRSGILSGDTIVKIDGVVAFDMPIDEAINLIRGPQGSEVILTIIREGEKDSLDISITRDTIVIPTINTELLSDDIFVISLYNFSYDTAEEFRTALVEYKQTGATSLVVDVRGNPGGFLETSVVVSSFFIEKGKSVVVESHGDGTNTTYRSKGFDVFLDDKDSVYVLVNGGSASASEILAGALRDHDIATIVGTQTFGKGSVQELVTVKDGTTLKVTIANWLTPNGDSISGNGITPDVTLTSKRDPRAFEDAQLSELKEYIEKQK